MTDEELIGFALDLLDPSDRAAVEVRLGTDPAAAARLERLRREFAILAADREIDPPRGLAVRTVARLAEYLVAHEPRARASAPTDPEIPLTDLTHPGPAGPAVRRGRTGPPIDRPEARAYGGRFRADLVVAAGIALVAFGLVASGIARIRHQSQVMACQNNLRVLHQGLVGYADDHGGRFPQVGTPPHPTAGTFVAALSETGRLPIGFRPLCPAGPPPRNGALAEPVGYTYTLGYRDPTTRELCGLRRTDAPAADNDLIPISADYPAAGFAPAAGPVSPHGRVVVTLFVGGHVRPVTTPLVGPNGDDIFRNWNGEVSAGLDPRDAVLGRPGDRP
jgi:hypothetical protein